MFWCIKVLVMKYIIPHPNHSKTKPQFLDSRVSPFIVKIFYIFDIHLEEGNFEYRYTIQMEEKCLLLNS